MSTQASMARSGPHEAVATVVRREIIARGVVSPTFSLPEDVAWPWQPGNHIDVARPVIPTYKAALRGPEGETRA